MLNPGKLIAETSNMFHRPVWDVTSAFLPAAANKLGAPNSAARLCFQNHKTRTIANLMTALTAGPSVAALRDQLCEPGCQQLGGTRRLPVSREG